MIKAATEGTSSSKKRCLSADGDKKAEETSASAEERGGKRPRVEGIELEAQLELKITDGAGSRLKLEKVSGTKRNFAPTHPLVS